MLTGRPGSPRSPLCPVSPWAPCEYIETDIGYNHNVFAAYGFSGKYLHAIQARRSLRRMEREEKDGESVWLAERRDGGKPCLANECLIICCLVKNHHFIENA